MFLFCHNLEGFLTYLYSLDEDVIDLEHTGDNKSKSHRDSNRKENSKLVEKRHASVSAATQAAESDDASEDL
jgi:hypothetical protein